ncbi:ABC transporter substrate-binding protein [Celeribacter litoreus]|uniref:ABC transporter substrate-binding protein n=1 Tax=Celeribacter litoreus TaxID=2876714 RepID=UPI001CCB707F|nr:ABC transporter substrate-binding protein [Celeribacter litoreus]MCA0044886.1 ABC transporter substrate-binding protein [Celeribacter litoreus]
MKRTYLAGVSLTALLMAGGAVAETVKIANISELSGPGAAAGTVWAHGVELAVDEINEHGGILGMPVEMKEYDSQTDPQVSRALVQKAIDEGAFALLGTVYSSSTVVNMLVAQMNGIPQFTASEAPSITSKGNPYIFRTNWGAQKGMPKIGSYLKDQLGVSKVAIAWANTEFGKGGHDSFVSIVEDMGLDVVADIPSEQGQADFSADVLKIKNSDAEAVFIYLTQEEAARFLMEATKQGLDIPKIGDSVLTSEKVIDLAGAAANGAKGHVALTIAADEPRVQEFADKFSERFGYSPDYNAMKGYIGAYTIKYGTEMVGEVNSQKLADVVHGLCLDADEYPGVLIDMCWDDTGEVSRESYMVEVVDGREQVSEVLPAN